MSNNNTFLPHLSERRRLVAEQKTVRKSRAVSSAELKHKVNIELPPPVPQRPGIMNR